MKKQSFAPYKGTFYDDQVFIRYELALLKAAGTPLKINKKTNRLEFGNPERRELIAAKAAGTGILGGGLLYLGSSSLIGTVASTILGTAFGITGTVGTVAVSIGTTAVSAAVTIAGLVPILAVGAIGTYLLVGTSSAQDIFDTLKNLKNSAEDSTFLEALEEYVKFVEDNTSENNIQKFINDENLLNQYNSLKTKIKEQQATYVYKDYAQLCFLAYNLSEEIKKDFKKKSADYPKRSYDISLTKLKEMSIILEDIYDNLPDKTEAIFDTDMNDFQFETMKNAKSIFFSNKKYNGGIFDTVQQKDKMNIGKKGEKVKELYNAPDQIKYLNGFIANVKEIYKQNKNGYISKMDIKDLSKATEDILNVLSASESLIKGGVEVPILGKVGAYVRKGYRDRIAGSYCAVNNNIDDIDKLIATSKIVYNSTVQNRS